MFAFALDVQVDCDQSSSSTHSTEAGGSTSTTCAIELERACWDESFSDSIFIASASSITLSLNRMVSLDETQRVSMLAVFVPPSVAHELDNYRDRMHQGHCKASFWMDDITVKNQFAAETFERIHPFLGEHGKILGIVRVVRRHGSDSRSAPADVLLLNVSNAPPHWTSDILATLNGESLACDSERVLRMIPLSQLRFTTATQDGLRRECEIPACPVCLHRIDPERLGLAKPQDYQLCSKFCISHSGPTVDLCRNQRFLRPWPSPANCIACHVIDKRWNWYLNGSNVTWNGVGAAFNDDNDESHDMFCHGCALQETLWVCLTCGFVGCGRYSHAHSVEHFQESGHPYSLELATLRIWDYTNGEFVHRGDLLECPAIKRMLAHPRNSHQKLVDQGSAESNGNSGDCSHVFPVANPYPVSLDEASPKKANMIGEEYEALLQSALEDQAQHYEGEISRVRAALTAENVDKNRMTKKEAQEIESLQSDIARYRVEIDRLGKRLLDVQGQEAGYRAASQRLLREQAIANDLLNKIREEAAREREEGRRQVEELEQQVEDLTANLRMRRQFSQNHELSNAQIFGTVAPVAKSRKGKKLRRLFRK